jgi:hypothetical protein
MEADWSVALGADDPMIVVPWSAPGDDASGSRFIDLRLGGGQLIEEVVEARSLPALRYALLELNSTTSPFWTVKCDAWSSQEPLDAYEMDAEPEEAAFGAGSYVDLLARDSAPNFDRLERWVRVVAETLRGVPARAARVEIVLRRGRVNDEPGYGVTWFVEGCGATAERAGQAWSTALYLALPVIMGSAM